MNWFPPSGPHAARKLVIGLVNNGSERGLKAIEDQFTSLLRMAAGAREIEIRLFTCPQIPRATRPSGQHGEPYHDVRALFDQRLDAVVVTGMEPQAQRLQDEPLFETMGAITEWTEERAVPAVWSCLAAHAAVLHLDGIARERLPQKLSGVFSAELVAADGRLADGLPRHIVSPHSRYHGLSEAALVQAGYEILTRSDITGPDIFIRRGNALSVFFQGHPEYEADTLLLEYRRDIRRYLLGRGKDYPAVPQNYFDPATEAALMRMRRETIRGSHDLARLDGVVSLLGRAALSRSWRHEAVQFYANWLGVIAQDAVQPGYAPARLLPPLEHAS